MRQGEFLWTGLRGRLEHLGTLGNSEAMAGSGLESMGLEKPSPANSGDGVVSDAPSHLAGDATSETLGTFAQPAGATHAGAIADCVNGRQLFWSAAQTGCASNNVEEVTCSFTNADPGEVSTATGVLTAGWNQKQTRGATRPSRQTRPTSGGWRLGLLVARCLEPGADDLAGRTSRVGIHKAAGTYSTAPSEPAALLAPADQIG